MRWSTQRLLWHARPRLAITLALVLLVGCLLLLQACEAPLWLTGSDAQHPARRISPPSHKASAGASLQLSTIPDPFIGTGAVAGLPAAYSGGETFPGADAPFGMVQWSPDTVSYAYSGYTDHDTRIRGFSLTHLSGAGCSAYGDLPFLPFVGPVTHSPAADPAHYIVSFAHRNEMAHAGFYAVHLDNGITTELSALPHSAAARFTYPRSAPATLLLNLAGSLNGVENAQASVGRDTISGWASSGNFCYLRRNTYRVFFWAQFSQPFASVGTWRNQSVVQGQVSASGSHAGVFVAFETSRSTAITVRVGLSFVSVTNAQANVDQEIPAFNFATVRAQAEQRWDRWLGLIRVSGGTAEETTIFYTALYHALLFPSLFSDVNGQYLGFDGRVHTVASGHAQYANFSGWDIYRSEVQLITLLSPAVGSDMAQSLVNDYEQSGHLPRWPLANSDTYEMAGDPSDAILADIYAFGGREFASREALVAMRTQASSPGPERPGLTYLDTLGYEPLDGTYSCCNAYGSAATTLEDDTADFALGAFAASLGDTLDARTFIRRAQDWRNLYDPATGYLEPRDRSGAFPFAGQATRNTGWIEGNSAQWTWAVPFNLRGLFDALGGNAAIVKRLDAFFSRLNAGLDAPYAFLGNEPTFEVPWEYDYAGAPYRTQQVVREAITTLYNTSPGGLPGNEDLGEISSWYVFAALGMYPETPGVANLVLASPLFKQVTLRRESGQTIQINAPQASTTTCYIQGLAINGQATTRPWLPPAFIEHGGTLNYQLSNYPNPSWGAARPDAPPSYQESTSLLSLAAPSAHRGE